MMSKAPYLVRKYYHQLLWQIPTDEREVFLTFDDGPTPGVTEKVLEQLAKHQAKATFFCIGKNVRKQPDLFQSVLKEGHSVGNHSMNHVNGWKKEKGEYIEDVMACAEVFSSKLFRPPYGKIRRSQASQLLPHYKIIMWSILTRDYDPKISRETCLKLAISGIKPGSIIVFHDSLKAADKMLFALEGLLREMKEQGYTSKALE